MMQTSCFRDINLLWVACLCMAGLWSLAPKVNASTPTTQSAQPIPDPKLKPQEVVRIVVDALSRNDANDNGIRVTWKFASPGNQSVTGPVERFIPMVKSPAYAPMLNSKSAQFSDPQIHDDQAVQMVLITAADGTKTVYVFQLSKQADGPLKDCWMTDGVFPVKPPAPPHDSGAEQPV